MQQNFDTTTQEYVEIIYELQKINRVARVKDIADKRGVSPSSVSTALNLLKEKALIEHDVYGVVMLTKMGNELGKELEERHQTIKNFFIHVLDIKPEIAEKEACILEHHINNQVFESLVEFIDFVENQPAWLSKYRNYKNELVKA